MEQAIGAIPFGMCALFPASLDIAREVAREAASATGQVCQVANINTGTQIVLSGHHDALEKAVQIAKSRRVRKAVRLEVGAPFHCSLLEPSQSLFVSALDQVTFSPADAIVLSNVTGQALPLDDPSEMRQLLLRQLVEPVDWWKCLGTATELGCVEFVEYGPSPPLFRSFVAQKSVDLQYTHASDVEL